jgi:hypothetical protein
MSSTNTVASTPAPSVQLDTRQAGALGIRDRYLFLFFAAAYGLAWLWFGVPILAARGLILLPVPEAVFLTLTTLGVCLAGLAPRWPNPVGPAYALCCGRCCAGESVRSGTWPPS